MNECVFFITELLISLKEIPGPQPSPHPGNLPSGGDQEKDAGTLGGQPSADTHQLVSSSP